MQKSTPQIMEEMGQQEKQNLQMVDMGTLSFVFTVFKFCTKNPYKQKLSIAFVEEERQRFLRAGVKAKWLSRGPKQTRDSFVHLWRMDLLIMEDLDGEIKYSLGPKVVAFFSAWDDSEGKHIQEVMDYYFGETNAENNN